MPPRYLRYHEIEKDKWDKCIQHSSNGLIYGYSFYLDALSPGWEALVLNDYKTVMPLTWKKKAGFYYLYQPFFCAALGIFSKELIPPSLTEQFLENIPPKFRYWDICLNHQNLAIPEKYGPQMRTNYVLSLNKDYTALFNSFRENTKRNIRRAEVTGCAIDTEIDIEEIILLAKEILFRISPVREMHLSGLRNIYQHLKSEGGAKTYAILSQQKKLLASCVFFFSHRRAYYILVGNHPDGKAVGASHALINAFIKDHAGQDLVLDFEGSDIRNLAFFYSSFGAIEERYPAIKFNKLPWWAKWLKQ